MMMNEYENFVRRTSRKKDKYWYACLGLAGETGEVVEQVKKLLRDDGQEMSASRRENIKLEMGDVLWYLTRLALECNLTLDEIMEANVHKLEDRAKNGKERE